MIQKKIKGEIPCPPHLARYLRWKESLKENEPLDIDQSQSPFAIALRAALLMNLIPGADVDHDRMDDLYGDRILFATAHPDIDYNRIQMPNILINNLLRFLYYQMYEEVCYLVELNIKKHVPINQTLFHFLDTVDLWDDISEDAFEKAFKRHRSRKKEPLKSNKIIDQQRRGAYLLDLFFES